MPILEPSQDTTSNINVGVLSEATALTVAVDNTGPEATQDVSISGQLTNQETPGGGVGGQTIRIISAVGPAFDFDAQEAGGVYSTATTDSGGNYALIGNFPAAGTYRIKARFPGGSY